ncbi:hypothetical protein NP233_g5795 [Leucocoprinus birnbaumii]|uniref:DUF1793-domain-containing protein n=1 Tax=Leucocoprinus birnbaumii TaxID=56174 RepID=A0AAD5YWC7_9AGAR|nr:hypothetical protein NP233_g5795 [Leucocoprinus birnbaumii]
MVVMQQRNGEWRVEADDHFKGAVSVNAQTNLEIPFVPLAVKSPLLNTWIAKNGDNFPAGQWPTIFTSNWVQGWACFARVDGQAYQWMGKTFNSSRTVMGTITPTKTIFRIEAGPIQFNATFFTPIEPDDYIRQSIPFSYLYVDGFSALDSATHTVQLYSDISAEWVARRGDLQVEWDTFQDETMVYHHVTRQGPLSFADRLDGYFSSPKRPGLTWQSGNADVATRNQFIHDGRMSNEVNNSFRAVDPPDHTWPVFSFSVDLGPIPSGDQPDPVVWTIGLVRDPILTYPDVDKLRLKNQTGHYWSRFPNISSVIHAFLDDFDAALGRGSDLDTQIITAANQISTDYAAILSLVTRQIFASLDITLTRTEDGEVNHDNVRIFMRDLGLDGTQRVNPVDVIYGALPAFLHFNSTIARHLLEPLLELQVDSAYAAPDLGNQYPSVFGNSSDTQSLAVESCASMLVMSATLQRWADFLVFNLPDVPVDSMTIDGGVGFRNSNLALKGIMGIYSMARITEVLNSSNTSYIDNALRLSKAWTERVVSDTHIQSTFDLADSWGLIYDVYFDIWLNFGITLSRQAEFYREQQGAQATLGIQNLQSNIVFPHWNLLTAATIPTNMSDVRNRLISSVHQRMIDDSKLFPLPMKYDSLTGDAIAGNSSSAIFGAAYGLLALNQPNVEFLDLNGTRFPKPTSKDGVSQTGKGLRVGVIVGAVVGSLAGAALVALGVIIIWIRKSKRRTVYNRASNSEEEGDRLRPRPFALGSPAPSRNNRIISRMNNPLREIKQTLLRRVEPPEPSGPRIGVPIVEKNRANASPRTVGASSNSGSDDPFVGPRAEEIRAEVAELRRELDNVRGEGDFPPVYI